jgi:hypothetical protein
MGEETLENNKTPNSDNSGASGSQPQSVSQPEEIFMQNLRAFRQYAGQRGAYFDEHGWLVYRGKVLTRADSEYLDQSETTRQRLLDEEEIKAAWDNLVSYVYEYEGEDNE